MNGFVLLIILSLVFSDNSYAGAAKAEYELQEHCKRSATEFVREKYKDWMGAVDFTNHFNRKLTKCFVNATFVYGGMRAGETDKNLWDINENKRYGQYVPLMDRSGPLVCEMLGKWCNSESEWNSFVKPYMEE